MKLDVPQKPRDMENILPLINVIFLLLVFFILSGIFITPELFEVAPPESVSEVEPEDEAMQILLSEDGSLAYGKAFITLHQFRQLLEQAKSSGTATSLQVKADRKVAMQKVFEVMDAVKEVDYEKFQLLTLKK